MKKGILITLLSILPISYSYADENESQYLDKARNSAKKLLFTLKNTLEENLKSGNTVIAVNVCSNMAQNIANNISENNKVYMKRVSLKYRNPNDKPDSFEEEKLNLFQKLKEEKKINQDSEVFEKVKNGDKISFRYMKPIVAGKTCLQCHGNKEEIKPEVLKLLKEKYPDDLAIDHKEGDIRGAVSVIINLEKNEQ